MKYTTEITELWVIVNSDEQSLWWLMDVLCLDNAVSSWTRHVDGISLLETSVIWFHSSTDDDVWWWSQSFCDNWIISLMHSPLYSVTYDNVPNMETLLDYLALYLINLTTRYCLLHTLVQIDTHVPTHAHTHTHTQTYIQTPSQTHSNTHAHTHTHTQTNRPVHIHLHTHTVIHTNMQKHTYKQAYTLTQLFICTHTHTHTHIHVKTHTHKKQTYTCTYTDTHIHKHIRAQTRWAWLIGEFIAIPCWISIIKQFYQQLKRVYSSTELGWLNCCTQYSSAMIYNVV